MHHTMTHVNVVAIVDPKRRATPLWYDFAIPLKVAEYISLLDPVVPRARATKLRMRRAA
jgi:hypothetical protein